MRFGLVWMLAVSAMDTKEAGCAGDDHVLLVHLRSRLSQTTSPALCQDVDDAVWEPLCKNWRMVIREGVYAKSTQVCCSAIPVPCQQPGQDCSSGEDCVTPSCHQLESYLQFYETKVVDAFGSVGAARECIFGTAKECGTADQSFAPTFGALQRALIATAVQTKNGDEAKEVEAVENELHGELLPSNETHSDGKVNTSSLASLADRASSSEVVSAHSLDTTLSAKDREDSTERDPKRWWVKGLDQTTDSKDDVTVSANNVPTNGVVGNEDLQ